MRRVEYLRSRSLPLLALVEAARLVFGTQRAKLRRPRREPSGNPGQLRLEGIR